MHAILFSIGDFNFYSHSFFALMGITATFVLVFHYAKLVNLKTENLLDNLIIMVFFGIIGARVSYYLLYPSDFNSFREIFYLWNGGMVSYGGFILGGLALYYILKFQKQPIAKWLDLIALAFPLGLILGRIGNLFAGDISGLPSYSWFAINGQFPVPALEILLLLIIFFTLQNIFKKPHKDGIILLYLIIFYTGGRFVIDFWRNDARILFTISFGQVVSLSILLLSVIINLLKNISAKGKDQNEINK